MTVLKNGAFVVFEGVDGVGKTTALNKTAEALRMQGYEVVVCGTECDDFTRSISSALGAKATANKDHLTQTLLFTAHRRYLLNEWVKPALKRNAVVLMDRYIASTHVYQHKCPWIDEMHRDYCDDIVPDLTLVLTAPLETVIHRVQLRGAMDHFDSIQKETIQSRAERLLKWAYDKGQQYKVEFISADTDREELSNRVLKRIEILLEFKR